ncbi:PREDICTED: uncharacterized protein LOC18611134 [Theobroma cacao]|uniref:Uncharacterized protein LOC18611134 n=2 Tax=Theobroma cacao TaxID=3641 RepID=A0AB32VP73_THECC|nr:PREDICTED: uncharacterized protein LOC18611134 [Theobroma cacao]
MDQDMERYRASNYLVLTPEEVRGWDVFRLLWSKKMQKKAYIYVPPSIEERVLENGLAITSLIAQRALHHIAEPLKCLGRMIEMSLNLVSFNRNIFMLLLNVLRCKVNVPDRTSGAFVSFIGHLDSRVKLDENINPGDARYNSALAAMASKLAYENKGFIKKTVEQHWKMEFIDMDYDFLNDFQNKHSTQGFMFHDQRANKIVVAFRGTEPFNAYDWSTDADISCFENKEMGKVHGGFMKALGLIKEQGWPPELPAEEKGKNLAYYSIREELRRRLKANKEAKFIVTGHSLGGALAILFPAILALHEKPRNEEQALLNRLEGVYTFGQPRVGDFQFKTFMEDRFKKYGIKYLRFVYCNDIIPRLPLTTEDLFFSLYTHFGACIYFNSSYKGQILDEEPHKNYISMFGVIRRFFNALSELLRSLYLPLLKGQEYMEGLPLILMVRFPALLCPGMADHNPQDYVNATRLGSITTFEQVEYPNSDSKKTN